MFDVPLGLSSVIKVKNLPILNEMQTQCAFISSHEKKVMKALRWNQYKLISTSSRWNQFAQTKKEGDYCKLNSKWCTYESWTTQFTRHIRTSKTRQHPNLGRVHHSPLYNILYMWLMTKFASNFGIRTRILKIFYIAKLWISQLCEVIIPTYKLHSKSDPWERPFQQCILCSNQKYLNPCFLGFKRFSP